MSHWIITEPYDNYEITMKVNLIGLPSSRQKMAEKLNAGDLITFYIPRKTADNTSEAVRKLMGQAKIVGDFILSDDPIWKSDGVETYPFRRKIAFIDSTKSVGIKEVLYDLSIIKSLENAAYWGLRFRNGMVEITEADWKLIVGKMGPHF